MRVPVEQLLRRARNHGQAHQRLILSRSGLGGLRHDNAHGQNLFHTRADNPPTESEPQYHGVNFSIDATERAQIPLEAGYQTTFKNDEYPRRYDIGHMFDRTPYTYMTYDLATKQLGSTNAFGRTMLYAQAKQMVYRPDMTSQRGLTLFGAVAFRGPTQISRPITV